MLFDFKKNRDWVTHLTIVTQLGLTMVGSIAFCFGIGFYLDRWLKTKGIFITIFILLGIIGGGITVYHQIMKVMDSETQGHGKDSDSQHQV